MAMIEMRPGMKSRRVVHVYGVDRPVCVTITSEGLDMRVAGSGKRQSLFAPWRAVAENMPTPENVKCFLAGKPIDFLNYLSAAAVREQIRREEKKNRG